ncbi:hypothetical protein [Streptomyces flaveolus]|uniref:hypothetical protein n=1 Tax=Streptomyces flaveolus TaxID=67297 RepID=UPI0016704D90|nr:hypothetical protein [Streptomyces flaveolus]GGQ83703.1 hypothetical protein GCM10010216_51950 [Streptomyces flaveolus]
MGYARYEITRPNGDRIEAGYAVEAQCEKDGCDARIDRGLAYLCGKDPRGDDHGCGGYFCEKHLTGANQCEPCAAKADEENRWVHPETGEEFDLRDRFLPAGSTYDPRSTVWACVDRTAEVPLLLPVDQASGMPTGEPGRLITEGEWEEIGRIIHRQISQEVPA